MRRRRKREGVVISVVITVIINTNVGYVKKRSMTRLGVQLLTSKFLLIMTCSIS